MRWKVESWVALFLFDLLAGQQCETSEPSPLCMNGSATVEPPNSVL